MEEKISFSEFIKNEIVDHSWTDKQLEILFYSFLRSNGNYKDDKFIVSSSLKKTADKFNKMFLDFYGLVIKPAESKKAIKYTITDVDFMEKFDSQQDELVTSSLEETKAYVAGIFLGKGWISSPSSRFYHCEVRVKDIDHSLDVQEAFNGLGIKTITILKNNWYYTYIKKAMDISNLIKAVNASQAVMYFEDSRIERDFIATFKKMESIENYNAQKSHNSSEKQVKAIKTILELPEFKMLGQRKMNLANLRLEKSTYSLSELQMEYEERFQEEISKSTVNNWLKSMIKISEMDGDLNA